MTTAATTAATAATTTNNLIQNYLTKQAQNVAADKANAASASASSSSSLASATSASAIGSNFNTFIQILTTQLKHQDPTNATDPNQFTQELVQFAGVEQQLNTNNDLQTLINLQKNNTGVAADLGYVGQYVEAPATGNQLTLQSGTAEIGYTLPAAAQNATVMVKDSSGTTVATLGGPTAQGLNYLSWNGQDSSGKQLPDGAYTFSIAATDATGATETITDIRVIGKVTGVTSNSDGTTNLSLGAISIGTSKVDAIFSPGNLPTAPVA
jgi:flagellar basal-body rod modification protein FlgD